MVTRVCLSPAGRSEASMRVCRFNYDKRAECKFICQSRKNHHRMVCTVFALCENKYTCASPRDHQEASVAPINHTKHPLNQGCTSCTTRPESASILSSHPATLTSIDHLQAVSPTE